ncbi:RraA family protein [Microvirga roseola]|uniref:RraA family protein n=1 Tax=Microvirga roseola TaxID=2883126 RepID=UPI001E60B668|nr:dimethylmenaquinone methyltransferase [Microvirga roseola]
MPTRLYQPEGERLSQSLVDQWRKIPAAVAADLLRGKGHVDPAIRPLRRCGTKEWLVGSAITAWCEAADYGPVHHAIAVAQAGDVIVVDAGGRKDAAMIGELLSGSARHKGIAGVIVDGAVRDAGILSEWPDFAVFSRWVMPRGPSSMERGSVNETIVFGGVPVAPFDLVIGDDDGLVVVPRARAEELLPAAKARVKAEVEWEAVLATGKTTLEVFSVPKADRGQ